MVCVVEKAIKFVRLLFRLIAAYIKVQASKIKERGV